MNGQDSFWKWFGTKLGSGTKEFLKFGGWGVIPMIMQGAYLGYINADRAYVPTLFLWMIPMMITALYDYWKKFVKKDC